MVIGMNVGLPDDTKREKLQANCCTELVFL